MQGSTPPPCAQEPQCQALNQGRLGAQCKGPASRPIVQPAGSVEDLGVLSGLTSVRTGVTTGILPKAPPEAFHPECLHRGPAQSEGRRWWDVLGGALLAGVGRWRRGTSRRLWATSAGRSIGYECPARRVAECRPSQVPPPRSSGWFRASTECQPPLAGALPTRFLGEVQGSAAHHLSRLTASIVMSSTCCVPVE